MTSQLERCVEGLAQAQLDLGLSITQLWWRYFALGGNTSAMELDAVLHHALVPSVQDYDLMALALNERCKELGGDHSLLYSSDAPG